MLWLIFLGTNLFAEIHIRFVVVFKTVKLPMVAKGGTVTVTLVVVALVIVHFIPLR